MLFLVFSECFGLQRGQCPLCPDQAGQALATCSATWVMGAGCWMLGAGQVLPGTLAVFPNKAIPQTARVASHSCAGLGSVSRADRDGQGAALVGRGPHRERIGCGGHTPAEPHGTESQLGGERAGLHLCPSAESLWVRGPAHTGLGRGVGAGPEAAAPRGGVTQPRADGRVVCPSESRPAVRVRTGCWADEVGTGAHRGAGLGHLGVRGRGTSVSGAGLWGKGRGPGLQRPGLWGLLWSGGALPEVLAEAGVGAAHPSRRGAVHTRKGGRRAHTGELHAHAHAPHVPVHTHRLPPLSTPAQDRSPVSTCSGRPCGRVLLLTLG